MTEKNSNYFVGTMKTGIIKIGNSRGIRIPETILTECQIEEEVDLKVENDRLIINPSRKKPRHDWDKKFKEMSESKEDKLLIPDGMDLAGGLISLP